MSAARPEARARPDARTRILAAAAQLLAAGGRDGLSISAVESAAEVQAPTIYRLFGDKRGLIDAVAERQYLEAKLAVEEGDDPVETLRQGWSVSVEFGLANPALFVLINGDPRPERTWSSETAGMEVLRARVRRVAAAGRLRVSEDRAVAMITASVRGTVLTLLAEPDDLRDLGLLRDMRDGLISAITTDASTAKHPGVAAAASGLAAALHDRPDLLTSGERGLLAELLLRLADQPDADT